MKQVLLRRGEVVVEDVPAPLVEPGTVLVRVDHSCMSIGTELEGVRTSGQPLWKLAAEHPDQAREALRNVAKEGLRRTVDSVDERLHTARPLGYSTAGTVLEVGRDINDLRPGDRVACAGAQAAHHAEIVRVPRNLTVPVPAGADLAPASTVALGAIALQGVRRANPTLGETFVVIGLGAVGQLAAQILKSNGCRVLVSDPNPARVALAQELGADHGVHPEDGDPVEAVRRRTGGMGADGVLVAAATPDHAVVSAAFRMCRKKGRVVVVGDVGLHLKREDLYEKELDFFISTSYGPGRYDANYEERGQDYPPGYVRWTENRNMEEYLRLLADGKVNVNRLITKTVPVDEAPKAYREIASGAERPLLVLFHYPGRAAAERTHRVTVHPTPSTVRGRTVRIAVVGAGQFARSTHLPNLRSLRDRFTIQAVANRTGNAAVAAARRFKAHHATTDYEEILDDADVDAVLLATRHNLHARMALEALRKGKHVLVEKPLALTQSELDALVAFYDEGPGGAPRPILLTGFNRRFSPFIARLRETLRRRAGPMVLNYRMNAGLLPADSWVYTEEGGGRNRGEACHIYDLFTALTGSRVVQVDAHTIEAASGQARRDDNFVATMTFEDGSLATLTYTSLGSRSHPKEQMEAFVDGRVYVLDDYRRFHAAGAPSLGMRRWKPQKGHREELEAFADAINGRGDWPIPLWQQQQATEIALKVEERLRGHS